MKLYSRLLVTMGTVLMTFGAPAAHAAAVHAAVIQQDHTSSGDNDDWASRTCGNEHRWGYGDGYSHQNASDKDFCNNTAEGGGGDMGH